ncbi:MAG TPA: hypothetical protein PKA17_02075, partial [Phenylobacterium sp.]|nr:hypothetical protein [Phenylobacterium sp.]
MKHAIFAAGLAAAGLMLAAGQGLAQTPAGETAAGQTWIHAGALLDRPGEAPRGASTLVVANGRVAQGLDGH